MGCPLLSLQPASETVFAFRKCCKTGTSRARGGAGRPTKLGQFSLLTCQTRVAGGRICVMSQPESGDAWYYSESGRQAGPVTAAALREMASSGRLGPQDLVWREGMGDWRPASAVPELAASLPVAAASWPVAPPPLPSGFAPPPPR